MRILRPAPSLAVVSAVSFLLGGSPATAADDAPAVSTADVARLPLSYAARPLTLPRLVLDPNAMFDVSRRDPTLVNLGVGAALGVTDDFEVQAAPLPLQLSPRLRYGQGDRPGPEIGATYRFVNEGSELGVHLDATVLALPATSGVILRPGLPMRFHPGHVGRIDFGVYLPTTIGRTTTVGFDLPFSFAISVIPALHLGLSTGFSFASFDAPIAFVMPFGVIAGYSIAGKQGPILDIDPYFRWPQLFSPNTLPQSESATSIFQVGVVLRSFFYL